MGGRDGKKHNRGEMRGNDLERDPGSGI